MTASTATPPLRDLQPMLECVTEAFAHTLGGGSVAMSWSATEWRIAHAVACMHGVSGLLASHPRLLAPPEFRAFLLEQRGQTAARQARFVALRDSIDAEARRCGIGVVALKGAALHELGLYSPGERPMADLDLYVHESAADAVARILAQLGFCETRASWKHRSFEPASPGVCSRLGEHASNALKIELHTRLTERLPQRGVDVAPLVIPRALAPGVQGYPSASALMLHLLQHAAGAVVFRALRLIQLHDIAALARRMSRDDWDALLALGAGGAGLWWAYPPLAAVAQYFDSIPARILTAARASCHWSLRLAVRNQTLTRLSLSNARISALPGIAWARTPREACTHLRYRLVPPREALRLRTLQARNVPGAGAQAWMKQTQAQRALRFLFGTPARPETLSAVRAALEQGAGI